MIRRQARFLGKPVRASAGPHPAANLTKGPPRGNILKQMHQINRQDLHLADAQGLELAVERRTLHPDEFRGT
jgi:hypothetical protein